MVLLGIILLIIGLVTGINLLWSIGAVLIVIGLILWFMGGIGGHRVY